MGSDTTWSLGHFLFKNELSINVRVYVWTLNSIPLIYMPSLYDTVLIIVVLL